MRFSEPQILAAANLFAELLVSKHSHISLMTEWQKGAQLYSGDRKAILQVETAENMETAYTAAGRLRQILVGEHSFHSIVSEIAVQLHESSRLGAIHASNGAGEYYRNSQQAFLELRTTSRGQHSWEVSIALENIETPFPYGQTPRINICLYDDGSIELWDRESDCVYSIPYDLGPALPHIRQEEANTRLLSPEQLKAVPRIEQRHFCRSGKILYNTVGESDSFPEIKEGVPTGKRFNVSETLFPGDRPPYYILLEQDEYDPALLTPAEFDCSKGHIKGVHRLDSRNLRDIRGISRHFLKRGIRFEHTNPDQNINHGFLMHKPFLYVRVAQPILLGYGGTRKKINEGDWINLDFGERGTGAEDRSLVALNHYTHEEMLQMTHSGELIACDETGAPVIWPPQPVENLDCEPHS